MAHRTVKSIGIAIVFVVAALAVSFFLPGCKTAGDDARTARSAFLEAAPRPQWWDRVDAREVKTYDELIAYWQDDDRSPNAFFKAAHNAIVTYPEDEDLVVNAINLMPYGDTAYPHTVTMLEFALDHYFDYDRPLVNYGGKSGDSIAGIAEKLASICNRTGDYGRAVEVIERLLDTREHEINDQMLELIALEYAEALHGYGRTQDAVAWLETAIDKYHGDWEKRLVETLQKYRNL